MPEWAGDLKPSILILGSTKSRTWDPSPPTVQDEAERWSLILRRRRLRIPGSATRIQDDVERWLASAADDLHNEPNRLSYVCRVPWNSSSEEFALGLRLNQHQNAMTAARARSRGEVAGELVVAGGDAAEVLEAAEHRLDPPAIAIASLVEADLALAGAGSGMTTLMPCSRRSWRSQSAS